MEYELGKRLDRIEQMLEMIVLKAYPEDEEKTVEVEKNGSVQHEKEVNSKNESKKA